MYRTARCLLLCSLFAIACDKPRSETKTEPPSPPPPATSPPTTAPTTPPAQTQPAPPTTPAAPEPTTPEEIDLARKNAMLAGKDADVIKYCEMAGIKGLGEGGKGDGQAQLGCALAACRLNQGDKAKSWAKGLPKPLKEQANKICLANKVVL